MGKRQGQLSTSHLENAGSNRVIDSFIYMTARSELV